MYILWFYAM